MLEIMLKVLMVCIFIVLGSFIGTVFFIMGRFVIEFWMS